jgi:AcrR family transcriptional regulator
MARLQGARAHIRRDEGHASMGLRASMPPATVRKKGRLSSGSAIDESVMSTEDPVARVRIRDAALKHFAEHGYDRATIRAIAQSAGVSHGMLRHHFGSKLALREACDDYVFEVLHRLNNEFLQAPRAGTRSHRIPRRIWQYAARSLTDGSPTAAAIFDEMVTMTERTLEWPSRAASNAVAQKRIRATVLTAMASGIPLFCDHLSRALGVDVLAPEGNELVMTTLFEIFAPRPVSDDSANATSGVGLEINKDRPPTELWGHSLVADQS